jgi:hypothetical protein
MKKFLLIASIVISIQVYSKVSDVNPEFAYYIQTGQTFTSPFNGQLIEENFFLDTIFIKSQRYDYLETRYGLQAEMIDLMRVDYDNWQKDKKQMEFNNNIMFGVTIGGVTLGVAGLTIIGLKAFNII